MLRAYSSKAITPSPVKNRPVNQDHLALQSQNRQIGRNSQSDMKHQALICHREQDAIGVRGVGLCLAPKARLILTPTSHASARVGSCYQTPVGEVYDGSMSTYLSLRLQT